MPAYDVQLYTDDGDSHWITVYYGPGQDPNDDKAMCGYTCPTLKPDGTHLCKVFGNELETKEAPSDGGPIVIARRCQECRTARQERW